MDLEKCPRCGEKYSSSYRRCPFCEEEDRPRKVKNKMRSGHRVTEKKKTYSGRSALIIILLLVLVLLTWVLFGEKIVARFEKPEEPESPVEDVTLSPEVNDDPFYDPSIGDGTGEGTDVLDPNAVEPPAVDEQPVIEAPDVSNAKLSSEDFTLSVGESVQLNVTGTDAAAVWSSKDPTVAVVGSSGFVTAINPGTTTITATVGDKTLEAIARVKSGGSTSAANTDISNAALNKEDFTAKVGESVQLKVTGTDAAVTWSIDNSSIASISSSGVVKGVKAGQTKAYAKVGGKTLTCVVRIK